MNQNAWLSTVIGALVLTACGSSGSGSGVANTGGLNNPTHEVSTPTSQPTSIAGVLMQGATDSTNLATTSADGKTFSYTFNGKTVDLTMPGVIVGGLSAITEGGATGTTKVVGGTSYSYSRFGKIYNNATPDLAEAFYTGTPTANMPTAGTAVYKGKLIAGEYQSKLVEGDIQFDVSFANKSIAGQYAPSIDLNDVYHFKNGVISGNKFSGHVFYREDVNPEGTFNGQFFGPNADELAGFAKSTNSVDAGAAVFGAKRQ